MEEPGAGVEAGEETEGRAAAEDFLVGGDCQAVEIAKWICRTLKEWRRGTGINCTAFGLGTVCRSLNKQGSEVDLAKFSNTFSSELYSFT